MEESPCFFFQWFQNSFNTHFFKKITIKKTSFVLKIKIGYFIDLSGYLFIRQPSALWFTATLAGFLSGTYSIAYAMLADVSKLDSILSL